ncbi:MAG: HTH domain-containing protein, partial [Sulfuricurvum sp.]
MGYKHDYDKAMTRLTTILSRLYQGEELSVTELAQEFAVSTRTIQRDF